LRLGRIDELRQHREHEQDALRIRRVDEEAAQQQLPRRAGEPSLRSLGIPAAMHEMTPAPGERLMSHDATKKASQVESDMARDPAREGQIL